MKRLVCITLIAVATLVAADLTPFDGTWKFNSQKSKLEGETLTFKKAADGMLVQTSGAFETKFRIDGKDYPSPIGYTVAWNDEGKNAWTLVTKLNGNPLFNARVEITPDENTLTFISEGKKPNGDSFKESARYVRTSGETGLIGTWRSEKVEVPAETMVIKSGADDLTMSYPDWKASVTAKLDGKEYPVTGPTVPPGLTFSFRAVDSRTVETQTMKDGKLIASGRIQVSADGKTLTETSTPAGEKRTVIYVYDRQ